jgi:hypothetical protein
MTFDELYDSVEALDPSISQTSMFGMRVLKLQGKVFAGAAGDSATFKLPKVEREAALKLPGVKPYVPMKGRPMKEWVEVPSEQGQEWLRLAELAKAYVQTRLDAEHKA